MDIGETVRIGIADPVDDPFRKTAPAPAPAPAPPVPKPVPVP